VTALAAISAVALALLLPLAVAAVRQRSLLTMAVRNIRRRRSEAVLVVGGALLSTAIITSAFVVGDIVGGSIGDAARTELGPVDITVVTSGDTVREEVLAAVADAGVEGIDGLLTTTTITAALEAPRRGTVLPRTTVAELDLDAARAFGSDPQITGLAGAGVLRPGQILLDERTAARLATGAGDTIRLHAYGSGLALRVAEVVPEVGLAGYAGGIVPPGTLRPLAASASAGTAPPRQLLLVSLAGGVFDTRALSDEVVGALRAAVRGLPGVEVEATKATLLDDAEREGAAFTELFAGIGAFSVLAGILLLVNLFVMMAEERKSELGMLRALGFTRRRLTRAFAIEGAIYALVAALAGAVVGVAMGWLIAVVATAIFADDGVGGIRLIVEPASLGIGAGIGLIISLLTVWATSGRIARLNVIRAIRDLPDPSSGRVHSRTLVLGAVGVLVGASAGVAGYLEGNAIALLVGVPLAAYSATPLLRRLLPERPARLLAAGTVLAWALAAYPLFPGIMGSSDILVFVVQGVVLTAGAVSFAASLDRVWTFAIERLGRGGLAARLGLAYPLARRFRTAMLLGMFSLVLFTVTIIAAMSATFDRNTDRMVGQVAAGFDVLLDTNPANPIVADTLLARDDVSAVAGLAGGVAAFESAHLDEPRSRLLTGIDGDLLAFGAPKLLKRDERYASDADAYRAVLDDPTLTIVPEGLLDFGGASTTVTEIGLGDSLTVAGPGGRESRQLTVVGMGDFDWLGNGALVGREVTAALFGARDITTRWYVAVADGTSPDEAAASLNVGLLANGAEASAFAALGAEAVGQDRGFMALVQGFLGLGLLVGIAGLAVVMIRAVRERRREIGMLRAMGFRTGLVRSALLSEAGLIAVQGTLIGAALGLVTARQLLTTSAAFADGAMPFVVPWAALVVIVVLPLAAVLAATAWPASRAAALRPAVALRAAD
jgi:putative ABC transport system permease protein